MVLKIRALGQRTLFGALQIRGLKRPPVNTSQVKIESSHHIVANLIVYSFLKDDELVHLP